MTAFRKYLTWLVCLLFCLGVCLSSSAGVVCLGDDGHVKVESLCQPCCGESIDECALENSESETDHHDCCGNCTDLPLFQNPLWKHSSVEFNYDNVLMTAASANPCFHRNVLSTRNTIPLNANKAPSNKSPDLLSTTVLVC